MRAGPVRWPAGLLTVDTNRAAIPHGFKAVEPDWSEADDYRERTWKRTGVYDQDSQLPPRLRCERCGWKGWGARSAKGHVKRCAGPVPDSVEFPPGPVWVDI